VPAKALKVKLAVPGEASVCNSVAVANENELVAAAYWAAVITYRLTLPVISVFQLLPLVRSNLIVVNAVAAALLVIPTPYTGTAVCVDPTETGLGASPFEPGVVRLVYVKAALALEKPKIRKQLKSRSLSRYFFILYNYKVRDLKKGPGVGYKNTNKFNNLYTNILTFLFTTG
jgi:hypothetical protein